MRRLPQQTQLPTIAVVDNQLLIDNTTHRRPAGFGVNSADPRGCGVYGTQQVSLAQEKTILDFAFQQMPTLDLLRVTLESDNITGTENDTVVTDKSYIDTLMNLVDHVYTTHHAFTTLSPWKDPTQQSDGTPTNATLPALRVLANATLNHPGALIGLTNEENPANASATTDEQVRSVMQSCVNEIRTINPRTVIVVPETRNWNDYISPAYENHPLNDPANPQSPQIVYSLHLYDGNWAPLQQRLDAIRSSKLPYIIEEAGPTGEAVEGFGPYAGTMTYPIMCRLFEAAKEQGVPLYFWTLQPANCFPSMTHTRSGDVADAANQLQLNTYGRMVQHALQTGQCIPELAASPALSPASPLGPPLLHSGAAPLAWGSWLAMVVGLGMGRFYFGGLQGGSY